MCAGKMDLCHAGTVSVPCLAAGGLLEKDLVARVWPGISVALKYIFWLCILSQDSGGGGEGEKCTFSNSNTFFFSRSAAHCTVWVGCSCVQSSLVLVPISLFHMVQRNVSLCT